MPTNDFLPWATGGGANVESQPDYLADTVRPVGYANGDSPPADQFNKALRQASSIASAVAAFIAAQTGEDVLDAGDIAALTTLLQSSVRIKLLANTSFYVATTGNNANNGLAVGTPWLTIQHAIDVLTNNYDFNGFDATINVADGAYTDPAQVACPQVGATSVYPIKLVGNSVTPANVMLTTVNGCIASRNGAGISVDGMKLKCTGAVQVCLSALDGGRLTYQNIIFDSATASHVDASTNGVILAQGTNTVVGNAPTHIVATQTGEISVSNSNLTLTGGPAFATAFAQADRCGVILATQLISAGAATGPRYSATFNGIIDVGGGGANYLPGNAAGSTATGGQYA